MGFGFSKVFVIFLAISIALAVWTKNVWNGVVLMGIFIVVISIWRLLTDKNRV